MRKSNNFYLFLALFLPLLMILITAVNMVFFKAELRPKYNFIYMVTTDYYDGSCMQALKKSVYADNPLPKISKPSATCKPAKLYLYDFSTKQSKEVSLQQVRTMQLSSKAKALSPDGFLITYNCYNSDFPLWDLLISSNPLMCLQKDGIKQKIKNISSYYSYFIGWDIKGKQNE